jgi:polysaccharide export outer membrane protein
VRKFYVTQTALACFVVIAFGSLSACSSVSSPTFPTGDADQDSIAAQQNLQIVRVSVDNVRDIMAREESTNPSIKKAISVPPEQEYVYRIGGGDVLKVNLWDNPERISPSGAEAPNLVVTEAGAIFYPYVGELQVEGKTVSQVRAELMESLGKFLQSPQVEVSVVGFNAHKATLVGQVGKPGQIPLTNVPMTLMDAINAAGRVQDSDLSRVSIRRGNRAYVVDLLSFIEKGRKGHNPVLLSGDIVVVDPPIGGEVYTFGEIGVGELSLKSEYTSLTSILAGKGGLDKLRADARGVFVFRARPSAARNQTVPDIIVYQFELDQPAMYVLAQTFLMRGGDVVFVTQDPISRWNDLISKLLSPVVTTIRAKSVADALVNP